MDYTAKFPLSVCLDGGEVMQIESLVEVRRVQPNRVSFETSRTINTPVNRLWAEVADFNHVAKWHPYLS